MQGGTQPHSQPLKSLPLFNESGELLRATRKVVSKAPAITGWEFRRARPPKQRQMRFTIEDRSGAVREVDASGWRYVLLRYPDGAHGCKEPSRPLFERVESVCQAWKRRLRSCISRVAGRDAESV